jgi:hypothetical protein
MRHSLLESIQWEIPADRQSNRLRAVKVWLSHNRLADKRDATNDKTRLFSVCVNLERSTAGAQR